MPLQIFFYSMLRHPILLKNHLSVEMSRDLDEFLNGIRATLKEWKQSQLLELLQDAQETTRLNDYIQMTGLSYYMIKDYLDSNGSSKLDPVLNPLVKSFGELKPCFKKPVPVYFVAFITP